MKLILSRKGFDSENGGIPSPILPDGTLLSLPIPSGENGKTTYHDIAYNGKSYYQIIRELNPRIADRLNDSKCHIDPDLSNRYINPVAGWKPAFGQHGASQLHLRNHHVGVGDVFLFYGWFRQTEYDESGRLRYIAAVKDSTPDRHIICGYMEIGSVITEQNQIQKEVPYHPHALDSYSSNNALYLPKETFSLDGSVKGWGTLKYAPIRQLTAQGHPRSEWILPDCFRGMEISYHENNAYGWEQDSGIFRAAYRGQEFVTGNVNDLIKEWVIKAITQE